MDGSGYNKYVFQIKPPLNHPGLYGRRAWFVPSIEKVSLANFFPETNQVESTIIRLKKTESRAGTNPGVGAMAARESRGHRLFSLEDR